MLEDIWNSLLELSSQFIIPDWGALVGLIPVGLLLLVLLYLAWLVFRFANAGPTRRGKRHVTIIPHAGLLRNPAFLTTFG